MALSPDIIAAAQKYGPTVDAIAKQYGITGAALLAKLTQGESGGRKNAVSSAGARSYTQFMPGSRQIAIDKYGIDPWADADQAIHAAALHLRGKINGSTGLAGYNPGSPTYTQYILGQKVGDISGGVRPASAPAGSGSPSSAAPASSGSGPAAAPALLGQGGHADFTSILSALTSQQPQQPQMSPIAAPAFSAQLKLPQGAQAMSPVASPSPESQDGLSGALSLVQSLGASAPGVGSPGADQSAGAAAAPGIAEQVVDARSGGMTEPANASAGTALAWARSKVGQPGSKETGGENRGKLADYANSRFGMSAQPWCAMFTSLAVTKGGAPRSARTASVAEVRRRALAGTGYEKGIVSSGSAQAGDLILFGDRHIGMVDHVSGGKVFYVGGNQSDNVTIASVPVGEGDIVRPKYGSRRR